MYRQLTQNIYDEVFEGLNANYVSNTPFGKALLKECGNWNYEATYKMLQDVKEKIKNRPVKEVIENWEE